MHLIMDLMPFLLILKKYKIMDHEKPKPDYVPALIIILIIIAIISSL